MTKKPRRIHGFPNTTVSPMEDDPVPPAPSRPLRAPAHQAEIDAILAALHAAKYDGDGSVDPISFAALIETDHFR